MQWVYLSPHFDDVALSCGGLVWEQTQAGHQVIIWTVCGGEPPAIPLSPLAEQLHNRWETGEQAVKQRAAEDHISADFLGAATYVHSLPDCIYRFTRLEPGKGGSGEIVHLYSQQDALFGHLHPFEIELPNQLAHELRLYLTPITQLVSPLALGGHVDHQLTRKAAELLQRTLWYYPDYPYALEAQDHLDRLKSAGWEVTRFPVSEPGMSAWESAVEVHKSQISSFWDDLPSMRSSLRMYARQNGGVQLWRLPTGC